VNDVVMSFGSFTSYGGRKGLDVGNRRGRFLYLGVEVYRAVVGELQK